MAFMPPAISAEAAVPRSVGVISGALRRASTSLRLLDLFFAMAFSLSYELELRQLASKRLRPPTLARIVPVLGAEHFSALVHSRLSSYSRLQPDRHLGPILAI